MQEYRKQKYIMWTQIEIIIYSQKNPLQDIIESFKIFESFEQEFSRFSPDSDLSKLNIQKKKCMSDRCIDVLNLSKRIHTLSSGYFNPLVYLPRIGYTESFEKNTFKKENSRVNLDYDTLKVEGNVVSLEDHQNLDLGGIIKWYSVDIVKDFLESQGYKKFIVNAGGDIYVSWKSTIAIDSPFEQGDIFALLDIKNSAISTSGTYKRTWKLWKQEYHHIISPETYTNNHEIISISIISKKCVISDTYATACIAMGVSQAKLFLKNQNMTALIICRNKQVEIVGNLDEYNYEKIE